MVKKKKPKDTFKEFRNNEKSAYKTFKIPLKTILLNCDTIQPVINNLVFETNDLVIHTYQFIRLYVLYQYSKNKPLPTIDETFILYCIKLHLFQTPLTFQEYDKNSTTTNSYPIIPDNVKLVPLLEYPVFFK